MADAKVTIEIVGDDIKFKKTLDDNKARAIKSAKEIQDSLKTGFSGISPSIDTSKTPQLGAAAGAAFRKGFTENSKIPQINFADKIAGNIGPVLTNIGLITAGFYALKVSIDATIGRFKLADEINLANKQFDVLTQKAGIIGSTFKDELEKATLSLVSQKDLIKATNQSFVQFESGVDKIPQLLNLAAKASKIFGGDVTANFETLSLAVARGTTRQLANFGIILKAEDVYKKYAKSIGVAADGLTIGEKQQALMNAVLEKGNIAFSGLKVQTDTFSFAFKKLSVAIEEATDKSAIAFNRTFGPFVVQEINNVADAITRLSNTSLLAFGTKAEGARAEAELLRLKIKELKQEASVETSFSSVIFAEEIQKKIDTAEARLRLINSLEEENKRKLNTQEQDKKQSAGPEQLTDEQRTAREKFAAEREQKELETQRKILGFEQQSSAAKLQIVSSEGSARQVLKEQENEIEKDRILKREEFENTIRLQRLQGVVTSKEQEKAALDAIDQDAAAKQIILKQNTEAVLQASEDRQLKSSKDLFSGFGTAAEIESARATRALQNFGARGAAAFNIVKQRSGDAFIALGAGSQTAGEVMKGFLFNSLADIAEAEGRLHLLAGFANPVEFAAGAGLLALSGFLRSQAGAAGAAGAGGSAVGGGGVSGLGSEATAQNNVVNQKPQTQIAVNIQGNVLDRRQTGIEIADVLNETFGTSDLKIAGIS